MELYKFFWGLLAWIATVAVFWPVNIPLLALAYKIQNGPKPIDIDRDELWYRSFVGATALGVLTLGFVVLDYLIVDWGELPPGPIHLVVLMGYVPAAVWLLFVIFAYTDMLEGLALLVIYLGMPIFVLFLLNAVFGWWNYFLNVAYGFLKSPI